MILNILLSLTILAEILGFSQAQEKILFFSHQKIEPAVLGTKVSNLPKVTLSEIAPLPIANSAAKAETDAKSALIVDLKTNKVLFDKNSKESYPIASITKLMSATIIVENFNLNDIVTVSAKAAGITGSKMHLLSGEQIKVKDLVNGMLIASANDAAKALEEHFGQEQLVKKMNQKAKFLNLKNSHFSEATGLDPENKSSAQDLILLTKYTLNIPIIYNAVRTKEYLAVSVDGRISHMIHTTNRLLKQYPDIFGVKTGYTEEAGSCLIAAADREDHQLISVVLGFSDYNQRFAASRQLLDWVYQNYQW